MATIKEKATNNDVEAQYALGHIYHLETKCIGQDIDMAISWYEKAAQNGHIEATHNLAMLLKEKKTEAAIKQAIILLERNAATGYAISKTALGHLYYEGIGVKKDLVMTKNLWEQAAKTDGLARYNLALLYEKGEGVKADFTRAVELMESAATDSEIAACELCVAYARGDRFGFHEKNFQLALPKCQAAALHGEQICATQLGIIYLQGGNGISKNYSEGIKWLKIGADAGDANAQYAVGVIFTDGAAGQTKDISEGLRYLQKAADQGHARAANKLNQIHTN